MNKALLAAMIADELLSARRHPRGMVGILIDEEAAMGCTLVKPGATEPFHLPADDWEDPPIITTRGNEVRIVAIMAKRPRTGAFRRLVANIKAAGLTPVVIEPLDEMPGILKRWGWKRQVTGKGWESCEEWRP